MNRAEKDQNLVQVINYTRKVSLNRITRAGGGLDVDWENLVVWPRSFLMACPVRPPSLNGRTSKTGVKLRQRISDSRYLQMPRPSRYINNTEAFV